MSKSGAGIFSSTVLNDPLMLGKRSGEKEDKTRNAALSSRRTQSAQNRVLEV